MTFHAMLTTASDVLVALTLIYCIVLERRIRTFRNQEKAFRAVVGEVEKSTRAAEGAVASLRGLMDEFSEKSSIAKRAPTPSTGFGDIGPARGPRVTADSERRPASVMETELAALAARIRSSRTHEALS
jgi:hypothetical protein